MRWQDRSVQFEGAVPFGGNIIFSINNATKPFVVTPGGVVVFDALGTPALGESMVRAIRTITKQPIRRVIVSHYHADHFYGL